MKKLSEKRARKQQLSMGWTEEKIAEIATYYDNQSEDEQVAEHEAARATARKRPGRRRADAKSNPLKLMGTTGWVGGPDDDVIIKEPVKRAFLRSSDKLLMDCQCGENKYAVSLNSDDHIHFAGDFTGREGAKEWPVTVQAKLYSNANGYLIFGSWVEDGGQYVWWADLSPVDEFSDEAH
jgi:hypothetical protein